MDSEGGEGVSQCDGADKTCCLDWDHEGDCFPIGDPAYMDIKTSGER